MSNAKIRSWVYRAIAFLILCGIAWYLLLHPSSYDENKAKQIFNDHKAAFQTTVAYLIEKDIETDILGFRTIDNGYGIRSEDTKEFRAFAEALSELQQSEAVDSVHSHGGIISFRTPSDGGFLAQNCAVLSYKDDADKNAALGMPLPESKWFYEIQEPLKKD